MRGVITGLSEESSSQVGPLDLPRPFLWVDLIKRPSQVVKALKFFHLKREGMRQAVDTEFEDSVQALGDHEYDRDEVGLSSSSLYPHHKLNALHPLLLLERSPPLALFGRC